LRIFSDILYTRACEVGGKKLHHFPFNFQNDTPLTKTKENPCCSLQKPGNPCCDARAEPYVSSPVPVCSEASFGMPTPEKKPPSFLRLASQQGKP
jgi:hypothetical protein